MGAPRIAWDGKTVDLEDLSAYDGRFRKRRVAVRSDSGVTRTSVLEAGLAWVEVEIEAFDDRTLFERLRAFEAWASRGKPFAFSFDAAKQSSTTLTASAAVGATSLTVASIVGFAAGDRIWLRSADGLSYEAATIAGAPSGSTLPLASGLAYAYAVADEVRHADYFPALELLEDQESIAREIPGNLFVFGFAAREYVS